MQKQRHYGILHIIIIIIRSTFWNCVNKNCIHKRVHCMHSGIFKLMHRKSPHFWNFTHKKSSHLESHTQKGPYLGISLTKKKRVHILEFWNCMYKKSTFWNFTHIKGHIFFWLEDFIIWKKSTKKEKIQHTAQYKF